ncbi:hypothetical protein ncot_13475 [Nocardioides sp. JQ2195]|uniref:hypothetical protein n=1 Tax=Nocardioides sp. JQ2195 TaxID=2592334 RepID=UPI00143E26C1|nr:hypothetical protein [Nocardioides sp. JQ2195]QIX27506.1 hypothetical protein ncot_13475 [Nocardioides sp. JQ2195]
MAYRDSLKALAAETEAQVLAAYAAFLAGRMNAEAFVAILAAYIAAGNVKAYSLADLSLAMSLSVELGTPVAALGVSPPADDADRLAKAAHTLLAVDELATARVGRLARSEPLEAAARAYSAAMNKSPHVAGWVRNVSGGACQLCTWWWREGQVWPADHEMPTHKGCTCTPQPVTA